MNPSLPVCASMLRISFVSSIHASPPLFPFDSQFFFEMTIMMMIIFPPLPCPSNSNSRSDNEIVTTATTTDWRQSVHESDRNKSLLIPVRPSTRVTLTSLTGALELDSILIDVCLCGEGKKNESDANRRVESVWVAGKGVIFLLRVILCYSARVFFALQCPSSVRRACGVKRDKITCDSQSPKPDNRII